MGVCGEAEKPHKKSKNNIKDEQRMSGIIEGSQKDNIKSSKNNKNQSQKNDDNEKEEEENEEKSEENNEKDKNDDNKSKNENDIKYEDLDVDNEYYISCPECKNGSLHVEQMKYDIDKNDFKVEYFCACNLSNNKKEEKYFNSLITVNEPTNLCLEHPEYKLSFFCEDCKMVICETCKQENHKEHQVINNDILPKEEIDNLIKIAEENKEQFKGFDIFNKLLNKYNKEKKDDIKENGNGINMKNNIEIEDETLSDKQNSFNKSENKNENNDNSDSSRKINKIENTQEKKGHSQRQLKSQKKGLPLIKKQANINNHNENILNQVNNISTSENNNNENGDIQKLKEYKCIKTLKGHKEKVVSLIKLKSGDIATGSYDYSILIWDIKRGNSVVEKREKGYVFCLLEMEQNMLLCGTSENEINLWNLNTYDKKCMYTFKGHQLWVNCLVKCNDDIFASASNDANIIIWDYKNRKYIRFLQGHTDCILSLIKLNDGKLCSGSADLKIKIWDWENKKCLTTLVGHEKWIKCLYQLRDDTLLSGSDDKKIKVWKYNNCINTIREHTHSVRALCQINDNYFASGGFDKTIKIWDINNFNCVQTLLDHIGNVICIIKYDNERFVSCSCDNTIKIWEQTDL